MTVDDPKAIPLSELLTTLEQWLQASKIKDYCPNGLQVEGKPEVSRLLCGVTASEALIDAAISWNADAILVHHGYFWKGEAAPVVGIKKRRLGKLLRHNISLLAYHLPLDVHPSLGNNVGLAQQLSIKVRGQVSAGGTDGLLWYGQLATPMTQHELAEHISNKLARTPLLIPPQGHDQHSTYQTIAWCTGGAQGLIDDAAALGMDLYLSGEISEPTVHSARESGICYVAAGHHATERYGVQLLGKALEEQFKINIRYEEIANPA